MLRDYTLALVTGFLLDCLLGDPEGLYHPVRVIGKYISWLEKRLMARGGNLRISALWLTASTVLFTMAAVYSDSVQDYLRKLAAINRQMAEMADCVVEVVYSIPVALKGDLPCA